MTYYDELFINLNMKLNQTIIGNVFDVLPMIPDAFVDCCVTSPPYWGLRDYGVEGQLGLEKTPEEYVEKMVKVFREVKRVLKDEGTLWLNLGDSYASGKGSCYNPGGGNNSLGQHRKDSGAHPLNRGNKSTLKISKLKPKDLVGIPWRVAFALQADGWYLRSDIIWSKPNPMPESVTDRPTKSHEYVFLLSKSERYYFGQEEVREKAEQNRWGGSKPINLENSKGDFRGLMRERDMAPETRNIRTVWTIPTQPTPDAHFATYPEKLVETCIKAGCPKGGIVLDTFMGSGTTARVSRRLQRNYLGIELNPDYNKIIKKKTNNLQVELFN